MAAITGDAVVVDGLRRRYGRARDGFEAVRGIGFAVRRGELFALLGTNGAGKTSALEVLEGLAPPTGGTVRVLGHDPYRERAVVRPRLGVMLQEGGLPSDLTALETARMWHGTLSRPRPAEEALELVELAARADVRVNRLSGGERRRLDLALALMGRPELLFLDEPTTGLDPESRRNTWRMVRGLLAAGTTVLLTTHYLEEAEELADRLAIMSRGELVTTGTPESVAAGRPSRISFKLPEGLSSPFGAGRVELTSQDLQRDLAGVLDWAARHRVHLTGLEARSPSLEEAFLAVADAENRGGATPAGDVAAGPGGTTTTAHPGGRGGGAGRTREQVRL